MNTRTTKFFAAFALLALGLSALWCVDRALSTLVSQEKGEQLLGGGNGYCEEKVTTCGTPLMCTVFPTNPNVCYQCKINTPNWLRCKNIFDAAYDCTQTTPPTNPWCGDYWLGTPDVGGTCAGRCNTKGEVCGNLKPTTTSVTPCP